MADFTSGFWSWFISIGSIGGLIFCFLLIRWMSEKSPVAPGKAKPMGHVWDEDLKELNNPLPAWWLNMFYITLVFAVVYLILFPGLGAYEGVLGWSSKGRYENEMSEAEKRYAPMYAQYSQEDLRSLVHNAKAMKTGARLFMNYCTTCHGSDAGGSPGFPSLRDRDWLYGGDAEQIKTTIMNGRNGMMPGWEGVLGREGVFNVSEYVLSLSNRRVNVKAATAGESRFKQMCASCHGMDGKGNTALGAPNLTDNVWLYGGSQKTVMQTIAAGRQGQMPAHRAFLGEDKVHLLAAYVYSLSAENLTR
ncbi:MAG: cytochrome-c oxidase, cbb3-type subunit III [Gammaproteobacteria bacterium]|nr:MAG: cytochrome-c oxidase, cbb3-type subunit III [Gammaproteobacteria bacterium]